MLEARPKAQNQTVQDCIQPAHPQAESTSYHLSHLAYPEAEPIRFRHQYHATKHLTESQVTTETWFFC